MPQGQRAVAVELDAAMCWRQGCWTDASEPRSFCNGIGCWPCNPGRQGKNVVAERRKWQVLAVCQGQAGCDAAC